MNDELTLEKFREVVAKMRENAIKPRTIKTKKEARQLTKQDPVGRKWKVGEEYYLVARGKGYFAFI